MKRQDCRCGHSWEYHQNKYINMSEYYSGPCLGDNCDCLRYRVERSDRKKKVKKNDN